MNPFPGLRPFRSDEDYLFFGREEQTLELLKRLASHRFVAVVGTSGSGKSSLVRCGLLSELQGGKMREAGAAWEIAVTHPGGNPLGLLAEALLEADLYDRQQDNARENLLATLSRSHFGLVEAVKQAGLGDDTNFLLVVDQFEEIFRFHEAGQEQQEAANEFVSLLLEAVSQSATPIYVVLTMRSDFIGECGQFEGLAEMVNRGEFLIPRLTREQYKRVIEGPIKVAGGKITPRLLQRLLNDLGQQADQLPCLQHALMRTWTVWSERGDSEALDLDDYQIVGRMSEALSLHADEIFQSLASDRQRELCRGIFQALTVQESENRGIRRPQRLRNLCQILDVSADELRPIIDAYRQHGVTFLTPASEVELTDRTIIDISHESLMRVWTRLRRWVDEEAQAAGIYRRLSESAELYAQRKAGLYRDPELGIALAWREEKLPNQAWAERYHVGFSGTMQFLEASRQASLAEEQAQEAARQRELEQAQQLAQARQERLEQQQRAARRLRSMIAGLAIVAAIAGIACVAALVANNRANRLATRAQLSADEANRQRAATQDALTEVAAQKSRAEDAKTRAELDQQKAENAEQAALAAEQRSREFRYATDIQLAAKLIADERANAGQVLARLASHDPAANEELKEKEDLRGFEWHYLKRLLESRGTIIGGIERPVSDCALAADGELIILNDDAQVLYRSAATGAESRPPLDLKKGRRVSANALSPDGRRVALSIAGDVYIIDAASGNEVLGIPAAAAARGLIFSPDGRLLVTLDNQIVWWDATTGSPIASSESKLSESGPVSISADGLTVSVGLQLRRTGFSVFRMNPETREVQILQDKRDANFGGTRMYAISPDGKNVAATQMFDGQIRLYDAATGAIVSSNTTEHAASVSAIGFGGGKMATAALDGTIKVWNDFRGLKSTEITLTGHTQEVTRVFFAEGDKKLVSVSLDKSIRIWDLSRTSASLHQVVEGRQSLRCQFSPDGLLLATADGTGGIRIKDAATGKTVRTIGERTDGMSPDSIAWSPDNRLLAAGYGGAKDISFVELWDLDRGERLAEMPGTTDLPNFTTDERSGIVSGLDFSPDGEHLVASFGSLFSLAAGKRGNSPLAVYHVPSRRIIRWLEGHKTYTTAVKFSRDGAYLASGSYDGTAILWDAKTWTPLHVLNNPDPSTDQGMQRVFDVAFSPDGNLLAMASYEGNVILWDVATGRHLRSLSGHANGVSAVGFSPDGRTLASGSFDKTIRLWSAATWQEVVRLDPNEGQFAPRALTFSPDGRRLVSTGGSAFLWSTEPQSEQLESLARRLILLLDSPADFPSRVRMLSENLTLHEALQIVARHRPAEPRVPPALAAAQANFHASREEWSKAVEAADRLSALNPDGPQNWLRTPGLLRLATAYLHQGRTAEGARLLAGGVKRRTADGLERAAQQVGLGIAFKTESSTIRVTDLLAGFPGQRGNIRVGDVVLKVDDVEMNDTTAARFADMIRGKAGRTVRLTVRHAGSDQSEVIEVITSEYVSDLSTGELLHALKAELNERIAKEPRSAALLELRAELGGQWGGHAVQETDYTAAIQILGESSEERAKQDLARLYRRRAEAYAGLKRWKEATADYARVIAEATSDEELLASQALAQASERLESSWLVRTSETEGVLWRFSTSMPPPDWTKPEFDDSKWEESPGGFGKDGLVAATLRTVWDTSDIWLRRSFEYAPNDSLKSLALRLYHDDHLDVYLNGTRIANLTTYRPTYGWHPLGDDATKALKPGTNVLAVHCRQFSGAQNVDVGLCDAALALNPSGLPAADPWQQLALAYKLSGDRPAIDQLVARRPQSAGLIGDLFIQGDNKEWQRAVDVYTRGIDAGKSDAALLGKRAKAYEALQDWNAASADWASAVKDNPAGAKLLAEFGTRLAEAGQHAIALPQRTQARELLETTLKADPGNTSAAHGLAQLLIAMTEPEWTVARPATMTAEQGATLTLREDGSILASGTNLPGDVYSLAVPTDLETVTAIELEVLPDPSLPNQGPGRHSSGNFQLEEFRVFVAAKGDPAAKTPVAIKSAWASFAFSAADANINGIINDESKTVWHVWGRTGQAHRAIFFLEQPLSIRPEQQLAFVLTNRKTGSRNDPLNLGRFRIALTNTPAVFRQQQSRLAAMKLTNLETRLATAFGMAGEPVRAAELAIRAIEKADSPDAKASVVSQLQPLTEVMAAAIKLRPNDTQLLMALARNHAERGQEALTAERPAEALADLEQARRHFDQVLSAPRPTWRVLTPTLVRSTGGATLTRLDDDSILASGPNPDRDVYTFVAPAGLKRIAGIRLEALADPSLPQQGPGRTGNGNFHLNELRVSSAAGQATLKDMIVSHDEVQGHKSAIDGRVDSQRGWSIYPRSGVNHAALFAADIDLSAGDELKFEMFFALNEWPDHNLGRFRLSVTDDPAAVTAEQLQSDPLSRELTDLEVAISKAYGQTGKTAEAAEALAKALTLAKSRDDRAKILDKCSGMEQALAELVKSRPNDVELQLALARSFAQRGQASLSQNKHDEALPALDQARQIYTRLLAESPPTEWTVLKPVEIKTEGGAVLTLQADGSILASGTHAPQDVYTLQFADVPAKIGGLRLEVLPDASLPQNGPGRAFNGNFVISEFAARLKSSAATPELNLPIAATFATHEQTTGDAAGSKYGKYAIAAAIDGNASDGLGWAILPKAGQANSAVLQLDKEIDALPGSSLTIVLTQNFIDNQLGRFRLSVTSSANAVAAAQLRKDLTDSGLADLELALARAAARQGRLDEAVEGLGRAVDLAPDVSAVQKIVRDTAGDEGVLEKLAAERPSDARFHNALARFHSASGDATRAQKSAELARSVYEQRLQAEPGNAQLAGELADLLLEVRPQEWTVLKPASAASAGGATLTVQPDASILASGTNPDRDTYTITAVLNLERITTLRLEAMSDPSLPRGGPGRFPDNGNFHLNEVRVLTKGTPVPLTKIAVTFSTYDGYQKILDGQIDASHWEIYGRAGQTNTALISTEIADTKDQELTIEMSFSRADWIQHNLGRFRLSASADPRNIDSERSRLEALKIAAPWPRLGAAYSYIGDKTKSAAAFAHALDSAADDAAKAEVARLAAPFVEVSAELAGRAPEPLLRLGQAKYLGPKRIADNQFQEAVDVLSQALEIAPDDVELLAWRAEAKVKQRKWPQAIDDYAAVIQRQTDSHKKREAQRARAEAQLRCGRSAEGAEVYSREMVLFPSWDNQRDALCAQLLAGNPAVARGAASRLCKLLTPQDRSEYWSQWLVRAATAMPGLVTPENREQLLSAATKAGGQWTAPMTAAIHYRLGNRKEAEPLLSATANQPEFLCLAALLAHDRGESDRARQLLAQAENWFRQQRAQDPSSHVPAGQDWRQWGVRVGLYREAVRRLASPRIAELDALLAKEPANAAARLERAQLLAAAGLPEEALADLNKAGVPTGSSTEYVGLRGRILAALSRTEEALADLNQAVASSSTDPRVYAARGAILLGQGDLAQARRDLEKSLELEPTEAAAGSLADLLLADVENHNAWTVLKPAEVKSELGATFSILDDHSMLAAGDNPLKDRYHVVLSLPADIQVTAVRLEALTDPSLPGNGPGRATNLPGTFGQMWWNVTAASPDGKDKIKIEFADAAADIQHESYPVAPSGHWNIAGGHGRKCTAFWSVASPVSLAAGATLSFEMQCHTNSDAGENLGRFRLSVSDDPQAFRKERDRLAALKVVSGWARLAIAYRLAGNQAEFASITRQHPEVTASIAEAFFQVKDWQQSLAFFDQAVTGETKDADLLARRAEVHGQLHQHDLANADWQRALALRPQDSGLRDRWLTALKASEQWDEIAREYRRQIDALPQGTLSWTPRGKLVRTIIRRGDPVFERLMALYPEDALLRIHLARNFVVRSDWQKAAEEYAKTIESVPASEEWYEYAATLLLAGKRAEHEQFMKLFVERAGGTDQPYVAYSLTRAAGIMSQPVATPEQLASWCKLSLRDERTAWFLHAAGLAQLRAGNHDEALKLLEESAATEWHPELNQIGLALFFAHRNDQAKARTYLDQAESWLKSIELKDDYYPVQDTDWLEFHLLLAEVKEIISAKTDSK
jgi:WD40 repeat protein/tetratricopeptide (TPR) repeat protein